MDDVVVELVEPTPGDRVDCSQRDMGPWAWARCVLERLANAVPCVSARLLAKLAGVDQRVASKLLREKHERYGLRRVGRAVYCSCKGDWSGIPAGVLSGYTLADAARLAIAYAAACRNGDYAAAVDALREIARRTGLGVLTVREAERILSNEVARLSWAGWGPGKRIILLE